MRIGFVAAWYDCWLGVYYSREKRRLYLMVPFVGVYLSWRRKERAKP